MGEGECEIEVEGRIDCPIICNISLVVASSKREACSKATMYLCCFRFKMFMRIEYPFLVPERFTFAFVVQKNLYVFRRRPWDNAIDEVP